MVTVTISKRSWCNPRSLARASRPGPHLGRLSNDKLYRAIVERALGRLLLRPLNSRTNCPYLRFHRKQFGREGILPSLSCLQLRC